MMDNGLSAGDIMALTKDNDGWTNNPFIYLVWLALLGNGNFFGRNGLTTDDGALTRAAIYAGNTSFTGTGGSSETGHSGNGYCRITVIELYTSFALNVNVGNTWKEVDSAYVNIGGTWKEIEGVWANIGGSWKESG